MKNLLTAGLVAGLLCLSLTACEEPTAIATEAPADVSADEGVPACCPLEVEEVAADCSDCTDCGKCEIPGAVDGVAAEMADTLGDAQCDSRSKECDSLSKECGVELECDIVKDECVPSDCQIEEAPKASE